MFVYPSSSNPLSNASPATGAVNAMQPSRNETPRDALFAPVDGVTFSQSPNAPKQQDTYAKPQSGAALSMAQAANSKTDVSNTDIVSDSAAQESSTEKAAIEQRAEQSAAEELQDAENLDIINSMKARDREVRTHEQAHMSVGGQYAGSASYTYQTGPDGVRYVVGGEVPIDISKVKDDPAATLEKMQQVQRAALAPAEPSAQDRQVAAQANQIAAEALQELGELERNKRLDALDAVGNAQDEQTAEKDELTASETKEALKEARAARSKKDTQESEQISAAERFAEYNARMQRINQQLLELSAPKMQSLGQWVNNIV